MTDEDKFVSYDLIEAIKSFPIHSEIKHCGSTFSVSPFDIYTVCPNCGTQIKLRSLSGAAELEDVFDAAFEWMAHPTAKEHFEKRQKEIIEDTDKDSVS
ncbi:MAG TPA: hypothetical protein VGB68_17180 [Pyrinomonadaceae bacterium]|jgi:predicted  nucleic acid-binding Zn-ribbon protein